ncbi:MAG: MBL fold metallo-hydrolase [Solobacterium sp.]|jgi:L-ascorbate metabolism protein UlaG (beta-lactamase superfamily)|nr:MBL fold metallo-hydrolase [Solobacterium sp.]MCH4222604.1 MBL fold metallo-hydrolase [Solobacterium sp.]MCH4265063.1 MBL fold metallo-hydrolase [Solobacterium sp.]
MTQIEYYGQSCFRVTADNGYRIVFDPYQDGSVPGLQLPEMIEAEEVLISHAHEDHNAVEKIKVVHPKMICPFRESYLTVPHDDANGTIRGMNQIRILEGFGIRIVHFGDLGRMLNLEEISRIKDADVIMIPVGGYFTIDARQANAIIEKIAPKLAIVMHFRTSEFGYSVLASLDEVQKEIPDLKVTNDSEVTLGKTSGIISMSPIQGI